MSSKKIFLLALILAIVAALTIFIYLVQVQNAAANVVFKKVVVAKVDIPAKVTITEDMVELKNVPKDFVSDNVSRDTSEVVGKVAKNDIVAGEQILKAKIAGSKDVNEGMAYVIPKGKRAITVSVNAVTGINGFVQPKDYVDIGVTLDIDVQQGTQSNKQTVTKIIVSNVEVLAVEKLLDSNVKKDKNQKDTELKTVTLLVNVDDTRPIMLANDKGTLHLILRSPADKTNGTTDPYTPQKLLIP